MSKKALRTYLNIFLFILFQAKVLLRNWREENVRQSDDVIDLWEELLAGTFYGIQ